MRLFAQDLRSTGELREDLDNAGVADLIWTMNSPDYYTLVLSRGRTPQADRLAEAADALHAYFDRMGAVLGALHASGTPNRRPPRANAEGRPAARSGGRDEGQLATRQAINDLFEPDRDRLRLPVEVITDAYLRLLLGRTAGPGEQLESVDRRQLIDLLLHGAMRPQDDH